MSKNIQSMNFKNHKLNSSVPEVSMHCGNAHTPRDANNPAEFTRSFSEITGSLLSLQLPRNIGHQQFGQLTAPVQSLGLCHSFYMSVISLLESRWSKHSPWVLIPSIKMRMLHPKDPCPCIPQGSKHVNQM